MYIEKKLMKTDN